MVKKYESVALREYEKFLRKMGKPVKVLRSGLFVCPKIPVLGCSPDAKITDLNCKHCFGLREVKCPSSKFNFTLKLFFTEKKDAKHVQKGDMFIMTKSKD